MPTGSDSEPQRPTTVSVIVVGPSGRSLRLMPAATIAVGTPARTILARSPSNDAMTTRPPLRETHPTHATNHAETVPALKSQWHEALVMDRKNSRARHVKFSDMSNAPPLVV